MQKIKKLLFPFFNQERHGFLIQRWWFRSVIVLYSIAMIITPFIVFGMSFNSQTEWCWNGANAGYQIHHNINIFNEDMDHCVTVNRQAILPSVATGLLAPLVIHYLIQLIFFKIVIDYIVLNYSKSKKEEN